MLNWIHLEDEGSFASGVGKPDLPGTPVAKDAGLFGRHGLATPTRAMSQQLGSRALIFQMNPIQISRFLNKMTIAAAVLGGFLMGGIIANAQVKVGDAFPTLATAGLAGSLPETQGKVVLVDFWASWCAPCKASFPVYGKMDSEYRSRGLVILAVSIDEKASAYEGFVKHLAPGFAVVRDADQKLVKEVMVPTMPTSYLVDRAGKVRFMHTGFHGAETEDALRKEIETLLAEKASP